MIIEYQRPKSIPEALFLLAREEPPSYPLGGGTVLNRGVSGRIAVIDLQSLGLNSINMVGNELLVGATVTLQTLVEYGELPADLQQALLQDETYNLRQMATVAGKLVTADGRSGFTTALLAMGTSIEIQALNRKPKSIKLGDWLPLRNESASGELITSVRIPVNVKFAYENIARSPADQPIVCAAIAQWPSGRTRLALGGCCAYPTLAMDGPNSDGVEIAGRNAFHSATDEWATAEYRQEMAAVLSRRCIERIQTR